MNDSASDPIPTGRRRMLPGIRDRARESAPGPSARSVAFPDRPTRPASRPLARVLAWLATTIAMLLAWLLPRPIEPRARGRRRPAMSVRQPSRAERPIRVPDAPQFDPYESAIVERPIDHNDRTCPSCGGDGECGECDGRGRIDGERCDVCNGSQDCAACGGDGTLTERAPWD